VHVADVNRLFSLNKPERNHGYHLKLLQPSTVVRGERCFVSSLVSLLILRSSNGRNVKLSSSTENEFVVCRNPRVFVNM